MSNGEPAFVLIDAEQGDQRRGSPEDLVSIVSSQSRTGILACLFSTHSQWTGRNACPTNLKAILQRKLHLAHRGGCRPNHGCRAGAVVDKIVWLAVRRVAVILN